MLNELTVVTRIDNASIMLHYGSFIIVSGESLSFQLVFGIRFPE